ncbi:lytic transglycosylase domain-containing protein [Kitasatospora azatica]|uniref:lytic transglycosylase domain-containing protein n=1 Tax=Kitasatospora azatica TaxID=58347 RepID=UPI001E36C075|nr:lytic murein transglycosylase [Kitasatospora azatica]
MDRHTLRGIAAAVAAMAVLSAPTAPLLNSLPAAAATPDPTQATGATPTQAPSGAAEAPAADGGAVHDLQQPPSGVPAAATPTTGSTGAPATAGTAVEVTPGHGATLPSTVFAAYRNAQNVLAASAPGCHLDWSLLAGIGQVESGQADGGRVDATGTTYTPILGPFLDGNGFAAIPDTDHGSYDGSALWDRAVGPMQFIPSTWASWGTDGNGDGKADPNNVYDAALTAGRYLCAGARDLSVPAQLDQAVLSYNRSDEYLSTVKNWMRYFGAQATTVPDAVRPQLPAQPGTSAPVASPDTSLGATPTTGPAASPSAPAPSASASASGSVPAPVVTPSPRPSGSPSASGTPSPSPSPSASSSPTGSPSPSPTASPSPGCPLPTGTPSPTPTPTATSSATATPSPSPSPTPSGPSASPTPTPVTPSPLPSGCPSPTPSASASPTPTAAPSPSSSPSSSGH